MLNICFVLLKDFICLNLLIQVFMYQDEKVDMTVLKTNN